MNERLNFNPHNPNYGKRRKHTFKETKFRRRLTWLQFKEHFLAWIARRKRHYKGDYSNEVLPEVDIDAPIPEDIKKELDQG